MSEENSNVKKIAKINADEVLINNKTIDKHLNNNSYVIESVVNEDGSWYRLYNDGWLEQGGFANPAGTYKLTTVTFLKPFINNNYSLSGSSVQTSSDFYNNNGVISPENVGAAMFPVFSRNETSFTTYCENVNKSWYACGKGVINE